jgi:hypothetical protein
LKEAKSVARILAVKAFLVVRCGILLFTLSSCVLLEPRGAREVYVAPGSETAIIEAEWRVATVRVEKTVGSASLQEEARSILEVTLAREQGRARRTPGRVPAPAPNVEPDGPAIPALSLDAVIREREFMRDYRSLNAVSVELRLYESDPARPVAMALYSENTRDTIESHAYLYRLIRKAMGLVR